MTKSKNTKRNLLSSVLALLLCVSMLVGTTFAWFTDSVESTGNIIKSGTLDIEMMWADGKAAPDAADTVWTDASKGPIFKSELWEPGYTEVRHIKIKNAGTLALKYQLSIVANGEVSKLADVIDVYYIDPAEAIADRAALAGKTAASNLTNALAGLVTTGNGNLKAGEEIVVTVALKMQESAGNEYQNLSIGSDFAIKLFATQYTYESDSFGSDYDKKAPWTGASNTDWYNANASEFVLTTAEELAGFARLVNNGTSTFAGKTVKLGADIDLNNAFWTPIGHNANGWNSKFNGCFIGTGYTISNLYVTGTSGIGLFGYVGAAAHIEGVTIDGAYIAGNDYVGAVLGSGYLAKDCLKDCTVKNATVIATPYLKTDGVTYDGGAKAGAVAGYARNGRISGNKAINCTVSAYRDLGGIAGFVQGEDYAVTVSGNSVEGVTLRYITVLGAYDSNTPNQNMGDIVGRIQNTTVGENSGEATKIEKLSFVVSNDAELTAVLAQIKSNRNYWNTDIVITMNANVYSANYNLYQYPTWNGKADGNSNLKMSNGVADHTRIEFVGVGDVVFTGLFTVSGWGQAGNGFAKAQAKTSFENVTFKGPGPDDNKDTKAVDLKAAANNVRFFKCNFKDAEFIGMGGSRQNAVGAVSFDYCTFENGNCLSQYFETLTMTNSTVKNAYKGFLNKGKAGTVTIDNCDIAAGEYFLRSATGGSGLKVNVTNSQIAVFEVDGVNYLVYYRGNTTSSSLTFTDCEIADGYMTNGVDADSTLSIINNYTEGGIEYVKDGVSGDITLYNVPADYTATTVTVPEGVTDIGRYAFYYNKNIEKIVLPSTVTTLDERAFRGTSASTVVLNEGLTNISYQAFRDAANVKSVVIPSTVTTIGEAAFQYSGVETLTVPSTVSTIEYAAMRDMKQLKTVTIEGNVHIPDYAFRSCEKLETVYIKGTDVTFGSGMIFTNYDTGDGSTITVYVANDIIKQRLYAADSAAKNYDRDGDGVKGYTIICEQTKTEDDYYVDGDGTAYVYDDAALKVAVSNNMSEVVLPAGTFVVPTAASGKVLTIAGNGKTVIDITTVPTYAGLPGATITFENVVIKSDQQDAGYNRGFAHTNKVTYNNCVINGTLGLNTDTEFNNCTFNISGNYYNLWTWGAPNVTLNGCTFNSDGKALLLYGGANTKLTVNGCTFNDNGGLTALKAAIEIGNDYDTSYELIVNNTTVNGYEINDTGINTGSTLWANKDSMGTDKLNVVIDGVDVY